MGQREPSMVQRKPFSRRDRDDVDVSVSAPSPRLPNVRHKSMYLCERTVTPGFSFDLLAEGVERAQGTAVSNATLGSVSHERAKHSRPSKVSACARDRTRRLSWIRPFRRTRTAIERSLRLIDTSSRVIEAAERFAARRPLRATRHYERVAAALARLQRSYPVPFAP
jgi:hypothetical protein